MLHGKMPRMHPCYKNWSYWFEILQTIIKSFEGLGQVTIFLLLALMFIRICNEGTSTAFCREVYTE